MWLSDYQKAIEKIQSLMGDVCFMRINSSYDGTTIYFHPEMDNIAEACYYGYNRKTGTLVRLYDDTWRNPKHVDVICEEKGENP